ncbi:SCO family protein [Deinococcus altitudinis]|uniref:SCO family protein n=1 Tax=Deinococcus altitudinis TaxID=468914 RepID=UPI003892612B
MKALTALLLALAALMGGVLAYRTYAPAALHGTALDAPHPLSRVTLLRDDGESADLADSGGKLRLIFFGYTKCPDVCPITLGVLARAWDGLSAEQQAKLQVQLISVDPGFDRPATLRRYLDAFSPAFRGYTSRKAGDLTDIQAAEKSLYVYSAKGGAPGTLIHGDGVALVDRQGRFVRVYNNDAVVQGELGTDLPRLLRD